MSFLHFFFVFFMGFVCGFGYFVLQAKWYFDEKERARKKAAESHPRLFRCIYTLQDFPVARETTATRVVGRIPDMIRAAEELHVSARKLPPGGYDVTISLSMKRRDTDERFPRS